ncbi:MAG: hypothetical protein ACE5ER_04395 [Nitrospinaceae bacterium]
MFEPQPDEAFTIFAGAPTAAADLNLEEAYFGAADADLEEPTEEAAAGETLLDDELPAAEFPALDQAPLEDTAESGDFDLDLSDAFATMPPPVSLDTFASLEPEPAVNLEPAASLESVPSPEPPEAEETLDFNLESGDFGDVEIEGLGLDLEEAEAEMQTTDSLLEEPASDSPLEEPPAADAGPEILVPEDSDILGDLDIPEAPTVQDDLDPMGELDTPEGQLDPEFSDISLDAGLLPEPMEPEIELDLGTEPALEGLTDGLNYSDAGETSLEDHSLEPETPTAMEAPEEIELGLDLGLDEDFDKETSPSLAPPPLEEDSTLDLDGLDLDLDLDLESDDADKDKPL